MKATATATATTAMAVLLLAAGSAHARPAATAPCAAQLLPNPGFERGGTGWTAGPRIVVLGGADRRPHSGRAYATFAGLDVTRSDSLRATVAIPAGCALDVRFWARGSTSETSRGDYLNMGLAVTGEPPKTRFSFAFDLAPEWRQYSTGAGSAATERTATISFTASETAGQGTTAFDVDDVTATLR